MALFVGEHIAKIDDKGRIVLPAAFKKALGEMKLEFVVVEKNKLNKCLDIHTEDTWKKNVKQFKKKLDSLNPMHDKLLQLYYQNFTRVGVAANGRINIPNGFLEFADLEKNVKFIGMSTTIRMVNADKAIEDEVPDEQYLEMLKTLRDSNKDK
jgi:MraZ protein